MQSGTRPHFCFSQSSGRSRARRNGRKERRRRSGRWRRLRKIRSLLVGEESVDLLSQAGDYSGVAPAVVFGKLEAKVLYLSASKLGRRRSQVNAARTSRTSEISCATRCCAS